MENVFLVPAKRKHIHSVEKGVDLGTVKNLINESEMRNIEKFFDDKIFLWGAFSQGRSRSAWDRMEEGDILLFRVKGEPFSFYGEVAFKTINKELAEDVWGKNYDCGPDSQQYGETWECIYFIKNREEFHPSMEISREEMNNLAGYKEGYTLQGITRVASREDRVRIIDYLGENWDSLFL